MNVEASAVTHFEAVSRVFLSASQSNSCKERLKFCFLSSVLDDDDDDDDEILVKCWRILMCNKTQTGRGRVFRHPDEPTSGPMSLWEEVDL